MENKFEKVMSQRTDEELIKIMTLEIDDYEPIAIEAAEKEIIKRESAISLAKSVLSENSGSFVY